MKRLQIQLLFLALAFSCKPAFSQCNVNDLYDKIISGYHSSIALKTNGTYAIWGSSMAANGSSDVLAPQDINTTNYPTLTGSVLKAALGGKSANSQVDQAILLTTTGLWAWGIVGNVLSSTLTPSAAFQRITSPTGANTYGLPTGVNPADVSSLFASYLTLCILTSTGNVWILTQASQAVEANGGTVTSAGTSVWKQVKTGSSTFLTNVTAVRGQVSSASYNAFMALTSTGQVYTWGNSSYLGSATASAARNYATLMTIPSEFTSTSLPKMIGVTGGIGTTTTTKNTYFLLSSSGSLYSLGDNTQKQCGDFTTVEKTSWVNAKSTAAINFNNVNTISVQEHTCSYPSIAVITKTGDLYTWGNNSSSMIGRTDNNTSSGNISASYDPGMPVIFTSGSDKAVSVEVGGHTLVYLKVGTTQFCYVGHRTNGSMGDGTTTSSTNGGYFASCSSTPSLDICGSAPTTASSANSTISASPSSIQANGTSTSTITITLKDASGNNLSASGGTIIATTTAGTLGTVTDNNNGTCTVILTSSSTVGTATISFSVNGTISTHTTQVSFLTTLPLSWMKVSAYRQSKLVMIDWSTSAEVNAKSFDVERSLNGRDWATIIANIPARGNGGNYNYEEVDSSFITDKLIYRIRQQDVDGHYTYTSLMYVNAFLGVNKLNIYPVPAGNSFHLDNPGGSTIKSVKLLNLNGTLIRSWDKFESSYNIEDIPSGTYLVRIEAGNTIQVLKLLK